MDVPSEYVARHRRVTRETNPMPADMAPSPCSPRVRLSPRLDLWLRVHPPDPHLVVALLVLAAAVAACVRAL